MNDIRTKWRGTFCMEVNPPPVNVVIFGANGDLAGRKLLPSLFQLHRRGLFHERSRILCCGRQAMTDEAYRGQLRGREAFSSNACREGCLESFLASITYVAGDYFEHAFRDALKARLDAFAAADAPGMPSGELFYFSTPSDVYMKILDCLDEDGLLKESRGRWKRFIFEKPFGRDLASARAFDARLHARLREEQIYRIDHYLGKETVQNILMFRFANTLFEPVWNSRYIESVRIDANETLGVENRAKYFDHAGLLRDMFQNHMLEMLSLAAMERPETFTADAVHNEKKRLFDAIRPFTPDRIAADVRRGQYAGGSINGAAVPAYRTEPGVDPRSRTETWVSARLFLDNPRWRGVPFVLTCGKRMASKRTTISLRFRRPNISIFPGVPADALPNNVLTLSVQPREALTLTIQAKHPGPKLCMGALDLDFQYSSLLEPGETMPDAYERLLLDAMLGDRMLFIRSDSIESAWCLLDPVEAAFEADTAPPLEFYPAGSNPPEL